MTLATPSNFGPEKITVDLISDPLSTFSVQFELPFGRFPAPYDYIWNETIELFLQTLVDRLVDEHQFDPTTTYNYVGGAAGGTITPTP
jgi:hypothetical protein